MISSLPIDQSFLTHHFCLKQDSGHLSGCHAHFSLLLLHFGSERKKSRSNVSSRKTIMGFSVAVAPLISFSFLLSFRKRKSVPNTTFERGSGQIEVPVRNGAQVVFLITLVGIRPTRGQRKSSTTATRGKDRTPDSRADCAPPAFSDLPRPAAVRSR